MVHDLCLQSAVTNRQLDAFEELRKSFKKVSVVPI